MSVLTHSHSLDQGLLTATAYSIRTNRILLIQGDRALKESFTPYHPSYLHDLEDKVSRNKTWANWNEWYVTHALDSHLFVLATDLSRSGCSDDYEKHNMTYLHYCVNPRPSNTICALESEFDSRVVKYRGNRAYLCRWAVNPSIKPLKLFDGLGVTDIDSADLFEVRYFLFTRLLAHLLTHSLTHSLTYSLTHSLTHSLGSGCLLRLALWPTAKLWSTVDELVSSSFSSIANGVSSSYRHQIGLHFRCGDASFANNNEDVVDSSCVLQAGRQWNGTHFMDDFTMESPVDHALCGKKIIENLKAGGNTNGSLFTDSLTHSLTHSLRSHSGIRCQR